MISEKKFRELALQCYRVCNAGVDYCKEQSNYKVIKKHLQNCAEKCLKVATVRELQPLFLWECGMASMKCVTDAVKVKDPLLKICADVCRKCEEAAFALNLENNFSDSEYNYARL